MKMYRVDFQLVPLILETEDDHQDHSGLSSGNDNLPYEHDKSIHDDPVFEQTIIVQDSCQAPDFWSRIMCNTALCLNPLPTQPSKQSNILSALPKPRR
jgi:hypothetical protein